MSNKSLFPEDGVEKVEDFGAMLDRSFQQMGGRLSVGDTFQGEILSIGKEEVFVSTGGSTDGILPRLELLDDKKQMNFKVGDRIEVVVLKMRDGEIRLRRKGARGASGDLDSLEDAFDMEIPVEGKVTEVVKGGFRVTVMGKSGFCPISQIDTRPVLEAATFIGFKGEFLITKFDKGGRDLVLSRRRVLELKKAEAEGEFMDRHKAEEIVEGTVSRLDTFGAFIDVGEGVEGLVHISEITWARLKHPSEMLSVGMPVRVKILKIEDDGGRLRISLSMKQGGGEADPWMQISEKFPVGTVLDGTVTGKETYGLFVQIAPAFQGLLPRSKWRDSTEASAYDNKKKGDTVKVRVDQILLDERKLTLGLPGDDDDGTWKEHATATSSGFGTFGDLLKGVKTKK